MDKIAVKREGFLLEIDAKTLNFSVSTKTKRFFSDTEKNAKIEILLDGKKRELRFSDCRIEGGYFKDGLGEGVFARLSGYVCEGKELGLELVCRIWADSENVLHCELTALREECEIVRVFFPAYFDFHYTKEAYSVLPIMQGNLLYNDVEAKVEGIEPSVFFERMGYMAFFGQIAEREGYIAVVNTPYDAGYRLFHPESGTTELGAVWLASMKKLRYTRKMCFGFVENADYNDLCKIYRRYAKEKGTFRTLREKAAEKKRLLALIGCPVIHTGALYSVKEGTAYYNEKDPSENYKLQTFAEIAKGLERLHDMGLKKAYLHLDGWGKAGYDQQHPDVFPPCAEAGGEEGMRSLCETCEKLGVLFAIHDQYRDYYTDAETFDEKNAILNRDGKRGGECTWYGGEQKYLCTSLAPDYVRRNLARLSRAGIRLDGVYLDVFSVIALEECYDPLHKMTRKENMEYRSECMRLLNARGLISSSEEPVEWAVPWLDLVHHGPYCFPVDDFPYVLTPVPLFNLVYHDCIIVPWELGEEPWGIPKGKDGYLYALLNGGMPYLSLNADEEELRRVLVACDFQSKVCFEEMERHEIVSPGVERAYYASYAVEVDFNEKKYEIIRRT